MVYSQGGLVHIVHTHTKTAMVILFTLVAVLIIAISFLILKLVRTSRRSMFLCAALIQQKEATQQAERKSMKKSLAFAMSSHDIRNSLAALNGIIDLCSKGVLPNSETAEYLDCMRQSTASLVGLLNSVLDTSKIEAGKMQLMEEEFSLAQAIEESVNLYYPNAMNKGIDLILDPCDGSVVKQGLLRGDCGRLKQVLNNLLHNAIKFTPSGHIVVRAWSRKTKPATSVFVSRNSSGVWNSLWRSISKIKEPQNELSSFGQEQDLVELVMEVEDTGKGIPKEKQKSVFEDFVQARESSLDHDEGTGLGLGIVQSLVRLMGGDILIMDKPYGEKGTCFRFNIFLSNSASEGDDPGSLSNRIPMEVNHWNRSFRPESSNIVLFMKESERRRVIHNFLQDQGGKVSTVDNFEQVFSTLERIKRKGHLRYPSTSGQSDLSSITTSPSISTPYRTPDSCINIEDGSEFPRRTSTKLGLGFALIVVDYSDAQFSDDQFSKIYSFFESFKKDVSETRCKIVWLYTPQNNLGARRADQRKLANCEIVVSKPLHGSRLLQILKLLPEYGGARTIFGHKPSFTEEITRPLSRHSETNEMRNRVLFGKNVLVAEDILMLQKIARIPLERHGARVTICGNGKEAVKLVCEGLRDQGIRSSRLPYDLIFMDCEMPIMNGCEATRQIRLEEKVYNVRFPIIALTAHAKEEEHAQILLAGVDAVMEKPLNDEKIIQAMHTIGEKM